MKIICFNCKTHIVDTSDKFIIGGPYDGSMFAPRTGPDAGMANYFAFQEWAKEGNLWCPNCEQWFIHPNGDILTEHGIVKKGAKTIDTSIQIIIGRGLIGQIVENIGPEPLADEDDLKCPKCSKTYKNTEKGRIWFSKHVETCEG